MFSGKVFVFTNILPVCKNDDGVATVLGHEIAHNVAHHAAEKMSSFYVLTSVAILLAALVGIDDRITRILLQLGFEMPNGRKQETEADFIGLQMMAEACFDPEEAVRFWDRMEKVAEYEPPQMLSTHPSSHNRQGKLKEWLPQAEDKRQQSDCATVLNFGVFSSADSRKLLTPPRA
jgi:predicted Zn-dependent protease